MRILWFTNTPSRASLDFGYKSFGGGWISSLENLLTNERQHELGICFFYDGEEYKKVIKDNVTYYGIPYQKQGAIQRIIKRHKGDLNDSFSPFIDEIINDHKPDLIHVFGTEQGYGKILVNKFGKVVFHMQGLLGACTDSYFPKEFDPKRVLRKSSWYDIFRGVTFYHRYLAIKHKAEREKEIIKYWKYFSGRTDYDRNYVKRLNPSAVYFHCEELLREEFFKAEWNAGQSPFTSTDKTIVLGTTINPNTYKGLDLIYKTVDLLSDYKIHWKVFGIKEDNDINRMVKKILKINNPVSSIQFCGPKAAADLISELKSCHFFVHPSYIDNSPNSVCEAQLLGMPVISSSVGGVNSLITHKENGFLFNPYDPHELAGLLIYLCNNYNLALAAAQKARVTAQKRHSTKELLNSINQMYQTIYNN